MVWAIKQINKLQAAAEHDDARCYALYYAFYYALAGAISPAVRQWYPDLYYYKLLLNELLLRIEELQTISNEIYAFKTDHAYALSLTVSTVETTDSNFVESADADWWAVQSHQWRRLIIPKIKCYTMWRRVSLKGYLLQQPATSANY